MAETNLPESFVERQSFRRLIEFANPQCAKAIPSRHHLGGTVLDTYAGFADTANKKSLQDVHSEYTRVNILSDGWENTSKDHLLGVVLSLAGATMTYGTFACGSRQDGQAIAEQLENILLDVISSGWVVGAIITDNAGNCARARRILALRWPNLIFLFCFAHQINLLVKDVLNCEDFTDCLKKAHNVVTVFNKSTAKWLPRLREVCMHLYGHSLALIQMAPTRWNSAQGMFASILRIQSALRFFYTRYHQDSDYPKHLNVLTQDSFYENCKAADAVIRPLAVASFRLQGDQNSMSEVLVNFAFIYRSFKNFPSKEQLIPCIEQRWHDCEQPLFMLCTFLNPEYYTMFKSLPETELTSPKSIINMCNYYFRRLLDQQEDGTLRIEVFKYYTKGPTIYQVKIDEKLSEDPILFWKYIRAVFKDSILPFLALAILSVVVNTATCERLFSELALIHTSLRNRLDPEKVKKISMIRQAIRNKNALEDKVRQQSSSKKPLRMIDSTELPLKDITVRNIQGSIQHNHVEVDEPSCFDDEQDGEQTSDDVAAQWSTLLTINNQQNDDEDEMIQEFNTQQEKTPFPQENDPNFPQEPTGANLDGIRGIKVRLADLFSHEGDLKMPAHFNKV
eukprot:jgi/Hompol1/2854/HPOL_006195-RA